ncbi:MAG: VOC family protein [Anaerolineales bacterium]|nr:VOC family protein [Anaerolineales bacterium]
MALSAKYVHTNLIAEDWRALAQFYIDLFGCKPIPPERDLSGEWLDRATGLPNAHLEGVHLLLPGHGENGPTLEIFQYDELTPLEGSHPNRRGFGHIAFSVDNVQAATEVVLSNGGRAIGEIVTIKIEDAGQITIAYVADPEGNIIELQQWHDGM